MEFTENCLKLVMSLKKPTDREIEDLKIDLPFDFSKKTKLAIFDLDETLVHCELKKPKTAEKLIQVKLPNGGKAKVSLLLFKKYFN